MKSEVKSSTSPNKYDEATCLSIVTSNLVKTSSGPYELDESSCPSKAIVEKEEAKKMLHSLDNSNL